MDQLQNQFVGGAKDMEIVVILGFCHSGSFVDEISGPKRSIITSAAVSGVLSP